MKISIGKIISALIVYAFSISTAYRIGWNAHADHLPTCLYLGRPAQNRIKPLGQSRDGHFPGIDWHYTMIEGGGVFVSLHPWKRHLDPSWQAEAERIIESR